MKKIALFFVFLILSIAVFASYKVVLPIIEQTESVQMQKEAVNQVDNTQQSITNMLVIQQKYKVIKNSILVVDLILWMLTVLCSVSVYKEIKKRN